MLYHRVQHPHGPARGALCCAGAFVVLLVLGQFGSVGLAGNSYLAFQTPSALPASRSIAGSSLWDQRTPLRRVLLKNCRAAAIR